MGVTPYVILRSRYSIPIVTFGSHKDHGDRLE